MPASVYAKKSGPRDTIVSALETAIADGGLPAGTKLMNTQQLASHFGVATRTVQAAMAHLQERGLITRRPGNGTFVADSVESAKTTVVGMILACRGHIWDAFTATLMRGLRDFPVQPFLIDSHELTSEETARLPAFRHLLAIKPAVIVTQREALARTVADCCPDTCIISLERIYATPVRYHLITPNYHEAGRIGAAHLLDAGHRTLSCLAIAETDDDGAATIRLFDQQLIAGMNEVVAEAGLPPVEIMTVPSMKPGDTTLAPRLKQGNLPDAVFSTLTHRAVELKHIMQAHNLRIPDDMAVLAGINTPHADAHQFTAIDLNYHQIALRCLETIRDVVTAGHPPGHRSTITVLPSIVSRTSTGHSSVPLSFIGEDNG